MAVVEFGTDLGRLERWVLVGFEALEAIEEFEAPAVLMEAMAPPQAQQGLQTRRRCWVPERHLISPC